MAQPQLSVRSARAKALAHRLAKKERRTVAQVVELALEAYSAPRPPASQAPSETAVEFWDRMRRDFAVDAGLDDVIAEKRRAQRPVGL